MILERYGHDHAKISVSSGMLYFDKNKKGGIKCKGAKRKNEKMRENMGGMRKYNEVLMSYTYQHDFLIKM